MADLLSGNVHAKEVHASSNLVTALEVFAMSNSHDIGLNEQAGLPLAVTAPVLERGQLVKMIWSQQSGAYAAWRAA